MGVLTSIGDMAKAMQDVEKMAKKMNAIKPSELKEYIDSVIKELALFCDCVETMTSTDRSFVRTKLMESKTKINKQYEAFVTELDGNAMRDEKNNMFSSFTYASRALIETLNYIIDNVDTLFNDKAITLYNTRISQVGVIGLIQQAAIVGMFNNYMLTNVTAVAVPGITIYPYREVYIEKNNDKVVTIVNDIYSRSGSFMFLNGIGELKKRNLDMFILDEDGKSNDKDLPYDSIPTGMKNTFVAGIFGLNIFRWLGETWASFRHQKYTKLQAEREWLATHTALLKMAAGNVDQDSEEYRRNVAIINKYNEMIAKIDQQLAKYFTED